MGQQSLLAGIEAGGTKYVCAVARSPGDILEETRFPTTTPQETVSRAATFFRDAGAEHGPVGALGIGTFGPADIDEESPSFGSVLTTPKEGWGGFDVVGSLRSQLGGEFPIAFDTDVNAAAIGEAEFGAGIGFRDICYVTVGTGIGGGFLFGGEPLHGHMHPEVGHMVMPDLEPEPGGGTNVCPFHESCWEGRASGPAIEARWGQPAQELGASHPAWELEAMYLAHGAINLTAAYSPQIIILGGGVIQQEGLIERVRQHFERVANGYWSLPPLDRYLQEPGLGQKAGIVGALSLAQRLL